MPLEERSEFQGTARFSVRRRLGAGAFGVVYEAFDRERCSVVALKTLRHASVEALYRLKREFRALSDIAHPNLVSLYELLADGDQWFLTMELIEGLNFLDYVGGTGQVAVLSIEPTIPFSAIAPGPTPRTVTFASAGEVSLSNAEFEKAMPKGSRGSDPSLLRGLLRQAVHGLTALHEAGKLHRDIKPSNVLVSRDGRLVLLDFGLVTELGPREIERSLAGTPTYMSPEQGEGVSEASDWYSLGVMLFEALTGRRPFVGSPSEMMWAKAHSEPPTARQIDPDVPADLNDLCRDLMRRDPTERPRSQEILRRLGAVQAAAFETSVSAEPSSASREIPFVGRHAQLASLSEALGTVRSGRAVTVYLEGASGMGKTALVRRFLDGLRSENLVVLSGRCYERESVPYKAMDSLVDALSEYLKRLPATRAEGLLPEDIPMLARLFPVLRRVPAIAGARRTVEITDAFEMRQRAASALRELLRRLGEQEDVILFIDDLQWGDADSAMLLTELFRPPDPPPLLLLACYRSEEAGTSPLLSKLVSRGAAANSSDLRRLCVEGLSAGEARDLAQALMANEASSSAAEAEAIAKESGGSPFFIDELVRFGQLGIERSRGNRATLDEVVRGRVLQLPEESRRFLEIVAVAGQPLDVDVARSAAHLSLDTGAMAVLRSEHLVRIRATSEREQVEAYHDRIREAIVTRLPAHTLSEHHRHLALALESSGRADPERLALHFQEAGDLDRAAQYATAAAGRAAEALAFDRAARFYRIALELGTSANASVRRDVRVKMGKALVNAGRGREAAHAFLAASDGTPRAETLDLERRAAAQLLQSGHVDEALPILERLTGRLGLTLIQPTWWTMLQFFVERALIRVRGFRYREREASEISEEALIRLDALYGLLTGVILTNPTRARELQNRFLLLALRTGAPSWIALAMAHESGFAAAFEGWRGRKRTQSIVRRALALAERVQNPHAIGTAYRCLSHSAFFEGRWKDSWEYGQKTETILRERCTGVAWDLDFTNIINCRGLYWLGELKELFQRLPLLRREARQRDDLIAATWFEARIPHLASLASDEPEEAREGLRRVVEPLPKERFEQRHYLAFGSAVEIALFEPDGRRAWDVIVEQWPRFWQSGLFRLQLFRIEGWHLRARAALARAVESADARERKRFLRSAERDARRIEREGAPWAMPLAVLTRAGVASARSADDEACRLLSKADAEFTRADMALFAAAARRRRGELLGGREGRALIADADAWMAGQEIKNPARMTAMLAPGIGASPKRRT